MLWYIQIQDDGEDHTIRNKLSIQCIQRGNERGCGERENERVDVESRKARRKGVCSLDRRGVKEDITVYRAFKTRYGGLKRWNQKRETHMYGCRPTTTSSGVAGCCAPAALGSGTRRTSSTEAEGRDGWERGGGV